MKWRDVTSLAAGLCLMALAAAGCRKEADAQMAPAQRPPSPVTVAKAVARDVPVYIDEIGKCAGSESVTITPQVAGKIMQRDFQDGADLKKNDPLFRIDKRPYIAQLDMAKAALAQAKAALTFAKIDFARFESIKDTKAISKQDYDTKKNNVDVAQAQVDAAQAQLENAQLNLEYCDIRSPITGRAGLRLVDAGNVVKANEGALLVIETLDPIYADFTIVQRDLSAVRDEMARGALKTLVRMPTEPVGAGREGALTFLDNSVQDGSGTVKLRATLKNDDRHFWPGQFVEVRLVLTTKKNAVLVPAAAVQVGQQGPYVFVVQGDTAEQRQVKLGQKQGDLVVIDDGVKSDEAVVTLGQLAIIPGGKVRIVEGGGKS